MTTEKLITPTVHRGGTSADELLHVRATFSCALHTAITALENMSPNARDYRECLGGSVPTFREAGEQQQRRFEILQALRQEIENEQESILDQS